LRNVIMCNIPCQF